MNRVLSYEYNRTYAPPAPFVRVTVEAYDRTRTPITVWAFVDSGADGTMLPHDILVAVGAEYEDRVRIRGTAGGIQRLDRYTVRIRIGEETVQSVSAVATPVGSEPLIGRDVLNHLMVTMDGPAEVLEVHQS